MTFPFDLGRKNTLLQFLNGNNFGDVVGGNLREKLTVSWWLHLAPDKRMSWVSALERVGGCKTGGSMFYNAPLLPSFATVFLKRERDGLLLNVIMLL